MKKILIIFLLILTTSCTRHNDLNSLAIIKSIGISHNEKYQLYAEVIEEIDKDNNPKMQVIETESDDIGKLFENIKLLVNKEIYLSHIDLFLLDFNLNSNDYQKLINYFLSNNELRNDFYCVISKDIKKVLENSKYDEIEELIETNKESKNIISITFEDIIKEFLDNKTFNISNIEYQDEVRFNGNYKFYNNKLERITDEKREN